MSENLKLRLLELCHGDVATAQRALKWLKDKAASVTDEQCKALEWLNVCHHYALSSRVQEARDHALALKTMLPVLPEDGA